MVLVAGFLSYGPSDGGGTELSAALTLIGIGAVLGFWVLVGVSRFSRALNHSVRVASTRVPSPAQIAALLEQEWGRVPTMPEVAAVHQMLTNQKNQALLESGLSLGALYLIDHRLH